MPTKSQSQQFQELIAKLEPEMQKAFIAAVTDVYANVDWRALLDALAAQDTDAAIAAIGMTEGAFVELYTVNQAAYLAGAQQSVSIMPMAGVPKADSIGFRFNMINPRAIGWIAAESSRMVTQITSDSERALRQAISTGYAEGRGPRDIATDLVGRVIDGRRQGGIVGLDAPRAERLLRVSRAMETAEGVRNIVIEHRDGTLSIKYKVNKATEQRILKAYRAGTAVPLRERTLSENQYRNALLKARADTIARTETASSVMSAREESWRQLVESKGLDASAIIKTWRHRGGATMYHRPDHLAMTGHQVRGLDATFDFPDGARLKYSHDPSASGAHTINCRCDTEYRLDRS